MNIIFQIVWNQDEKLFVIAFSRWHTFHEANGMSGVGVLSAADVRSDTSCLNNHVSVCQASLLYSNQVEPRRSYAEHWWNVFSVANGKAENVWRGHPRAFRKPNLNSELTRIYIKFIVDLLKIGIRTVFFTSTHRFFLVSVHIHSKKFKVLKIVLVRGSPITIGR